MSDPVDLGLPPLVLVGHGSTVPERNGSRVASLSGIVVPYQIEAFFTCLVTLQEQIPDKLATRPPVRDSRATPNYSGTWSEHFSPEVMLIALCHFQNQLLPTHAKGQLRTLD